MRNAQVTFTFNDVRDMVPDRFTDQQVKEWLANNRKHIEDAMLRAGWDAIDTLLSQDGMAIGYEEVSDE